MINSPYLRDQLNKETTENESLVSNVSEEKICEAVESVFDILQLEPDWSDSFYALLVEWLDDNDVEIIPMS